MRILKSKPLVGFLFLLAPRLLSSLFSWPKMDSPFVEGAAGCDCGGADLNPPFFFAVVLSPG